MVSISNARKVVLIRWVIRMYILRSFNWSLDSMAQCPWSLQSTPYLARVAGGDTLEQKTQRGYQTVDCAIEFKLQRILGYTSE